MMNRRDRASRPSAASAPRGRRGRKTEVLEARIQEHAARVERELREITQGWLTSHKPRATSHANRV